MLSTLLLGSFTTASDTTNSRFSAAKPQITHFLTQQNQGFGGYWGGFWLNSPSTPSFGDQTNKGFVRWGPGLHPDAHGPLQLDRMPAHEEISSRLPSVGFVTWILKGGFPPHNPGTHLCATALKQTLIRQVTRWDVVLYCTGSTRVEA
jgi:hypothetical protein